MATSYLAAARRPPQEMQQKNSLLHESFFSLRGVQDRPVSVATEFMESDFDDDEILSDLEDGENSPRASLNSSGQPSFTTVSSYDEVQTPRSSRMPVDFPMPPEHAKSVEGPRGPHLFRSSTVSAEFQNALSLSPLTPKVPTSGHLMQQHVPLPLSITPLPNKKAQSGPFRFSDEKLDTSTLASWSPEMVAQWMLNAGIELPVCDHFVENDINGSILITLKFEDLKELGIPSFGVRTTVWNQINAMKNIQTTEPLPDTPIEDEPDRQVRRELRRHNSTNKSLRRGPSTRRKNNRLDDIVTPLESVSIVGIEQMMPKPHVCSKGENCSKWKRNQRMMDAFKKDHPFVDMDKGGIIMIAGDPGNPETARAIMRSDEDEVFRPVSDAIPSVVASSDVLGPGILPPTVALDEDTLRAIQSRDPQDNVRQFLDFQHHHIATTSEVPPTPPFELFPARQQPHEGLRALPKLAIPSHTRHSSAVAASMGMNQHPMSAHPASAHPSAGSGQQYPLSSQTASAAPTSSTSYTHTAIEESPERTPTAPYRFGTPFTEVDVPVTAVPLGPVARDVSQSVPPDMNYRAPPTRTMSRASARRPSFPVLPSLDENRATPVPSVQPIMQQRAASAMGFKTSGGSITNPVGAVATSRALQPPPRVKYPWSPDRSSFEKAIAPLSLVAQTASSSSSSLSSAASGTEGAASVSTAMTSTVGSAKFPEGVSYQGPVKKRKTKMLRHEWHDRFVTLKGTRLNIHKDEPSANRTLEYIDIDDYAIACSSLAASTSKLNAAFKAMNIRRGSADSVNNKGDVAAFSFQLIPQDGKGGVRLKKRDSTMPSSGLQSSSASSLVTGSAAGSDLSPEAVNGTGKTHHFAVKNRDERIEWMRELMLAKAMRQKGEGFEVSVNGNMI